MSGTNEGGELDPPEPECRLDIILAQLAELPGVRRPEIDAIAAAVGFLSSFDERGMRGIVGKGIPHEALESVIADSATCRRMLEVLS